MTFDQCKGQIIGLTLTLSVAGATPATARTQQAAPTAAKSSATLAELLPPTLRNCNGSNTPSSDVEADRRSIYVPELDRPPVLVQWQGRHDGNVIHGDNRTDGARLRRTRGQSDCAKVLRF